MKDKHLINTQRIVRYVALNFTTGLTDLKLKVRKPDGTEYNFGDDSNPIYELTLTEVANGEYEGSYTPDVLGEWQEYIYSSSNGDKALRSYVVVDKDITTVSDQVSTLDTKVDDVQAGIDNANTKLDSHTTKLDNISSKLDAIDSQVNPGGYFSN